MSAGRVLGPALYLFLLLPAVRRLLEAGMVGHMAVQIPLLAAAGYFAARGWDSRRPAVRGRERSGWAGLLLALLTAAFWCLPRSLDFALTSGAPFKFVTVPLLIGVPLALSWPRLPSLAKGIVLLNSASMLSILGLVYLFAPVRICVNYLEPQQVTLGRVLVLAGAGLALALLLFALAPGTGRPPADQNS